MATSIDLTGEGKYRICVTGVSEFIGAHLAKRLKEEGHYIVGCDWKRNEHMQVDVPSFSPYSHTRLIFAQLCFLFVSRESNGFWPKVSIVAPIFEYFWLRAQEEIYCNKFIQTDLRRFDNCRLAVRGCDYCFNFAYNFVRFAICALIATFFFFLLLWQLIEGSEHVL